MPTEDLNILLKLANRLYHQEMKALPKLPDSIENYYARKGDAGRISRAIAADLSQKHPGARMELEQWSLDLSNTGD